MCRYDSEIAFQQVKTHDRATATRRGGNRFDRRFFMPDGIPTSLNLNADTFIQAIFQQKICRVLLFADRFRSFPRRCGKIAAENDNLTELRAFIATMAMNSVIWSLKTATAAIC